MNDKHHGVAALCVHFTNTVARNSRAWLCYREGFLMWLAPDLMGPQRGPATPSRLRAQFRQVDTENREAREVRAQWMRLMGCDEDEISEHVSGAFDLCLTDELEQLAAAMRLSR